MKLPEFISSYSSKRIPVSRRAVLRMEKPDEADFHDFPTREETEDAFNTLIGWCVGQGMPPGNYTHEELCDQLKIYLNLL